METKDKEPIMQEEGQVPKAKAPRQETEVNKRRQEPVISVLLKVTFGGIVLNAGKLCRKTNNCWDRGLLPGW